MFSDNHLLWAWDIAALGQDLRHGGDPGGDTALHVHGAPAVEDAVPDLGLERAGRPGGGLAGRDDVGVAGEAEVRRGGPAPGVEVLDPRLPALAARPLEGHAAAGEAAVGEHALKGVHGARVGGRDGRPADQITGQFDRIDDRS